MHANGELIDSVLRQGFGFDGLVVADFTGIQELVAHGLAPPTRPAPPSGPSRRR